MKRRRAATIPKMMPNEEISLVSQWRPKLFLIREITLIVMEILIAISIIKWELDGAVFHVSWNLLNLSTVPKPRKWWHPLHSGEQIIAFFKNDNSIRDYCWEYWRLLWMRTKLNGFSQSRFLLLLLISQSGFLGIYIILPQISHLHFYHAPSTHQTALSDVFLLGFSILQPFRKLL